MLSKKDLEQLSKKGITDIEFENQLNNFQKGFPYINLAGAATVGDGIVHLSDADVQEYASFFEKKSNELSMIKFVPASGAASRMFKDIIDLESQYDKSENKEAFSKTVKTIENVEKFAFCDELEKALKKDGFNLKTLINENKFSVIASYILKDKGLGYQSKPKAMLLFHKYDNEARTAFEEHLVEGVEYAQMGDKTVHLHFTISPEHRSLFENKIKEVISKYEERYDVKFDIQFSEQMSKTDMVALDKKGELIRNEDGSILFRPGGHGALIENLNALEADLIFIKNIDNVTTDALRGTTYLYKKALAGYLLHIQTYVHRYLRELEALSVNEVTLSQIEGFAAKILNIRFSMTYFSRSLRERISYISRKLNRPIRVCGMVRNEGEPGGGPYWVRNEHGHKNLQIIEASQIDFQNPFQVEMVQKSSHFNPVDIICAVRNYKGNKFNLKNYIDKKTGFISQKKQNGIDMTIQELPGLWNGSMADWNTIFIEVPVETFTPVKTMADLLRKEHQ
ncbi:MAG: DUF4301 family protein [Paludibacteraceae bacterium]|nr:DUF4301 family protein [Paludibacteraceae bacterium]